MACALAALCAALSWSTTISSTRIADTLPATIDTAQFDVRPVALRRPDALAAQDTTRRRRAVTLSDWYYRRLTTHRYGSYVMLPLFAGQYVLGQRLLAQKDGVYDGTRRVPIDASLRRNHQAVALGVGTLFAVNTTTGLWNLWDARRDGAGGKRRVLHVLSMLGADIGFVTTGLIASKAVKRRPSDARTHRNVALASMGLATAGVSLMWF